MSQWKLAGIAALALVLGIGGYAWSQGSAGDEAAVRPSEGPVVRVMKTATCGCCGNWVDHLRASGFQVETEDMGTSELVAAKHEHGVPQDLFACHTAIVDGYVVEGHVPASEIRRLLDERPEDTEAIAVPGMPVGSPGMEQGDRREPYDVIAVGEDGERRVYASY